MKETKDLRVIKSMKTKKKITEVALNLFAENGYENVTVDEIVEKSQTSKGAFYGHFHSKHEVFLEKFQEIDNFYDDFVKTLSNEFTAEEKIMKLAIAQMNYLKNVLGKEVLRVIYMNSLTLSHRNLLSNTDRKLYVLLETFIAEGLEAKEFDKCFSKKELSILVSRAMRGTLYDWFIFEEEMNPITEIESTLEVVLKGMRPSVRSS